MIQRIDHVSIAVRDYEKALSFFQGVLGALPGAGAADESMKYTWQIFSLGDMSRIELLKPTGRGSFLDNFLSEREGGVHHITLQTPDIAKARERLTERGIPFFGYHEYGDLWKELFIHPRDAFGVLIQIAEFNADDWLAETVKLSAGRRWAVEGNGGGVRLAVSHPGGGTAQIELSVEEARALAAELREKAGG